MVGLWPGRKLFGSSASVEQPTQLGVTSEGLFIQKSSKCDLYFSVKTQYSHEAVFLSLEIAVKLPVRCMI